MLALLLAACGGGKHRAPAPRPDAPAMPTSPWVRPVPEGLGVNIHWYEASEAELKLLEESGIGIVRMDVSWMAGEPKPGEYDFSRYDRLMEILSRRRIRLMFILDYANPHYDSGKAPCTEAGRTASAKFCAAMAARYAGRDVIWELWNEPNSSQFWRPESDVGDYLKWCQTVVKAMRAADPKACIVGPGCAKFDEEFLDECFARGFLDLVDGVTVHAYRDHREGPETAGEEFAELAARVRPIPVLSGEWGYTSLETGDVGQAKYLARQWLHHLASGIPISIWYDWKDDGAELKAREHHFGTITHDLQPKLAYVAMKALTSRLRGFTPKGWLGGMKDEDYVAVFERGDERVLAAWTTAKPHRLKLERGMQVERIETHLGEFRVPTSIELSDAPVYVELKR